VQYIDWDELKNAKLKAEREVCFEDVLTAINEGNLLDDIPHPNQKQYKGQRVFIVEINNYVFVVPYIEDDERYFLKTVYPSRKFTSKYLSKRRKQ
jgi:hypothetical protein